MTQTNQALVLIEYQNDFLSPGGKLHDAIASVLIENRVLERTNQLIAAARAAEVPVVHVLMEFHPGHRELEGVPSGILALARQQRAFERGSWGAEPAPGLDRRDDDLFVGGKRTISAFESTNLDGVLNGLGARRIFLAGQLTNLCIESTMRSAYDRGFDVFTVTDAMSTLSTDLHRTATEDVFPFFSRTVVTRDFEAALQGRVTQEVPA